MHMRHLRACRGHGRSRNVLSTGTVMFCHNFPAILFYFYMVIFYGCLGVPVKCLAIIVDLV